MRSFLRKALGAIAVFVAAATSLQADYVSNGQATIFPGNCPCNPEPIYGYAYNPPVFFEDGCGWSAEIAFIYWKPYQEGISYGATTSAQGVDLFTATYDFAGSYDSTYRYPRFDWDAGFRVGVGYRIPCDVWDLKFVYTHYRTDARNGDSGNFTSFSSDTGGTLVSGGIFSSPFSGVSPFLTIPQDFSHYDVSAYWKVQYNQLDLTLSREYFAGRFVTFRPFTGLRALFIDQKYNINASFTGSAANTTSDAIDSKFETTLNSNNFKGVGLVGGFDTSFGIGCGLSIYGQIDGAITYGQFTVRQRYTGVVTSATTTITLSTAEGFNNNIDDTHSCLLAQGDLGIGFQWRDSINCGRNNFSVKLGWEHHVLFDYNKLRNVVPPQFQSFANNSPSGSLQFYGLVFEACLDF